MKIFTCCNDKGAIMAFDQCSCFHTYEITGLGKFDLEHEILDVGAETDIADRVALLKDNDCGILICGRLHAEAEDMLDRLHINPLAGCIGPADMAVKAFMAGEQPPGYGCGGDCGCCSGSCGDN